MSVGFNTVSHSFEVADISIRGVPVPNPVFNEFDYFGTLLGLKSTSSEGLKGDSVWSSRATWVMLNGKKDGKEITIGMFDHPANPGYPAYWHARGYGLFAVNPLGQKVFSKGKEELNFSLKPGQSVSFRYRVIIHSGNVLTKEEMNKLSSDFGKSDSYRMK